MRYRDAGVDIARGDSIKDAVIRQVRSTWNPAVVNLPGGFAGVMRWRGAEGGPLLLAATLDGVGTKLHLAMAAKRVSDAAADLVYHGANDLLVYGARPLAFLDYIAQARLDLGGETAEMPDTYVAGVVDVAGCMIGSADPAALLDGSGVRPGDILLGLASSGLHTNGYSLARRVLESSGLGLGDPLPGGGGESLGDALLAPHRWYGRSVLPLLREGRVRALAHVTGGGIATNLARVLPPACGARLRATTWNMPPLMRWLIEAGEVPIEDARSAFNLGIGLVVVSPIEAADALRSDLERAGERVARIGEVVAGEPAVEWVEG
ncbi:MAG: phosphoribosylformylglycinamidine cyclo-ligase [Candidatus Eisenbacteria bacterium]|nr:phosphoribosylformylglycinamidine cyclo-ligase [Candidatus Eisenbacteria bacterium]